MRFSQLMLKFTCSKQSTSCSVVFAADFKYSQFFHLYCWEKPSKDQGCFGYPLIVKKFSKADTNVTSQSTLLNSGLPHHPYHVRKVKAFQGSCFDRNTNLFLLLYFTYNGLIATCLRICLTYNAVAVLQEEISYYLLR